MQLRGSASCSMGLGAGRRSARGRVSGHKIPELSTEGQVDREEGHGWTNRQKAQQEQEEVRQGHRTQGPGPTGTCVCYWKIDGKRERWGGRD